MDVAAAAGPRGPGGRRERRRGGARGRGAGRRGRGGRGGRGGGGREQASTKPYENVLGRFQDHGGEELCEECCGREKKMYFF